MQHGKTTRRNVLVELFCLKRLLGATLCGWNVTRLHTHTKQATGLLTVFTCSCDSVWAAIKRARGTAKSSSDTLANTHTPSPSRCQSTQSHTPAALVRSHPGQQRSSRGAAGGVCRSCWPGTMMSHSCWGRESETSWHPGEETRTLDKMSRWTFFLPMKPAGLKNKKMQKTCSKLSTVKAVRRLVRWSYYHKPVWLYCC